MFRNGTANVIIVVDPCEPDYAPLVAAGQGSGIRFTFLRTGEQALGRHADEGILAWMINMQLPDMSGLELRKLLWPQPNRVAVIMVDDQYDAAREVSVLTIGHPHYASKPLDCTGSA